MTFQTKLGLHHLILFTWLGLFVGMIIDSNLIKQMGWIEYIRIIGFLCVLYGITFFISWRNRVIEQPNRDEVNQ